MSCVDTLLQMIIIRCKKYLWQCLIVVLIFSHIPSEIYNVFVEQYNILAFKKKDVHFVKNGKFLMYVNSLEILAGIITLTKTVWNWKINNQHVLKKNNAT